MDAGPIWATETFPMIPGQSKSQLYNSSVSKTA